MVVVQGQQKFVYHPSIGNHNRPKLSDAGRMGIASTRSQLTAGNFIMDGTLESLSVYEHGRVGMSERKIKNKRFL